MSVDKLTNIKFPETWGICRAPIRPRNIREVNPYNGASFNDLFDWENLWCDAFQIDPNTIVLLGPPLYFSRFIIEGICEFITPNGTKLKGKCEERDRLGFTVIKVPTWTPELILEPGNIRIKINYRDSLFDNENVIVTGQQNNPIKWLRDWIIYHRDLHKINSFIIYDNNSTIYTTEELYAKLSDLNCKLRIVEYPEVMGPIGKSFADGSQLWDSDFGYTIMLEHSKLRYLIYAKTVMNMHPDELLVIQEGTFNNIVDQLYTDNVDTYNFHGRWIEAYDIDTKKSAHLIDFDLREYPNYYCTSTENTGPAGKKWITIPMRSLNNQWCPHHVSGPSKENPNLYYGHFLSHNTNWAWKRDEYTRSPNSLIIDQKLKNNMNVLKHQQ